MMSEADALFTQTQQRVLGLLFSQPDVRFYTNEIVRHASMGRGTVSRELERLTAAGIAIASREGNQIYYQANAASPIYPELLGLIRKTSGLVDVLREVLAPLLPKLNMVFVYGSMANATDTRKSDVDLFVIADGMSFTDLIAALLPAEESLRRTINPTIYSWQELQQRLDDEISFVTRVLERPKLWVKGSDDEFAESGKSGQDRSTEKGDT